MIYAYTGIGNTNHFIIERDVMDAKTMKKDQNETTVPDDITIIWVNIIQYMFVAQEIEHAVQQQKVWQ